MERNDNRIAELMISRQKKDVGNYFWSSDEDKALKR